MSKNLFNFCKEVICISHCTCADISCIATGSGHLLICPCLSIGKDLICLLICLFYNHALFNILAGLFACFIKNLLSFFSSFGDNSVAVLKNSAALLDLIRKLVVVGSLAQRLHRLLAVSIISAAA